MEKIIERKKQAWDNMFYSTQRLDLLIVSLSGAGIYVCLETIKYFATKTKPEPCGALIKISGFIFILAIILNFLSQHYGFKGNEQDYLMCDAEMDLNTMDLDEQKKETLSGEIEKHDKLAETYSKYTKYMNYFSMLTLFVGLILIVLFFAITF